ncbi:MAG TPA: hypothetical protein VES66_00845 [Terriglobales bacterium]|nr:hypothetical protein [Terriglobales bacterium]
MKRQLSLIAIAALVLSLSGCPFRKKQPPVPQQGQAPTVQPEPAPPPPAQPPAETQPTPPAAETQPEKTETTAEKPKPKKKPSTKKPAAAASSPQGQQQTQASAPQPAPAKTSKLVIQEGSAPNSQGQLAAGVGLEDSSSHSKQTTEQLLQSTQANLNSINRPLSPEEQAMVTQIKDYMAQARKATADSDTVRARNLALKARLLSDELVKH